MAHDLLKQNHGRFFIKFGKKKNYISARTRAIYFAIQHLLPLKKHVALKQLETFKEFSFLNPLFCCALDCFPSPNFASN